ncbi:MAG TPA: ABC transporter [Nitrospiraceae bacterium]|nr:ABC transporter [Nitrospiraceae bacterium]
MLWYPVFYREMLLFRKKILRFGYVFSSLLFPIIYLLAFGMWLGREITIGSRSYIEFLLPGIVAMTSMTNSFNLVLTALSMGRLYFKSFQVIKQSPIPPMSIMTGIVISGIVRGFIAAMVIVVVGAVIFGIMPFTHLSLLGLALNLLLFSSMGVVVGMLTKDPEDNAVYNNFFIMPMAFFSGTFFPIDRLPPIAKEIVTLLPLSYTNTLMRSQGIATAEIVSIAVLFLFSLVLFLYGARLIKNYSE